MSSKRRIWILIFSGFLILSCGYLIYWFSTYQKYDKTFAALAEAAVPKMGELNSQLLSELPQPLGVELIQQGNTELWSPLGTRMYYVYLHADYEITQASPEEIVSYYHNLLKANGWEESQYDLTDPTPDNFYTYYRDSAEIEFSIYYSQYLQKYTLAISHDFWSQDFSPPKPNRAIASVWCKLHYYVCTAPTTLIRH